MGFDTDYKKGKNLSVLEKGKSWYSEYKDVNIVRYKFITEKLDALKSNIEEDVDLKNCSICSQKLYELDDDSQYNNTNNIVISQKRHIVFISDEGKEYNTCYRLNHCFKRSGKPIHGKEDFECSSENIGNINFEKVVDNPSRFNDMFLTSANEDFQKEVKPFIEKWVYEPVDKKNIQEFMNDFQEVERYCKKYCNDPPRLYDEFKEKVLKIVGVHI